MTRRAMFLGSLALSAGLGVATIGAAGRQATREGDEWITRPAAKVMEAATYTDPAGRFTLDYPKKDWRIVPPGYASLVTFNHKDTEATIIVERQELARALSPSAIGELFMTLQVEEIRKLDPLAKDVKRRILEMPPLKVPAFEYVRRPTSGGAGADYVRIYLLPHGAFLYRVVCRSEEARLQKHAPAFALVAASLQVKETE